MGGETSFTGGLTSSARGVVSLGGSFLSNRSSNLLGRGSFLDGRGSFLDGRGSFFSGRGSLDEGDLLRSSDRFGCWRNELCNRRRNLHERWNVIIDIAKFAFSLGRGIEVVDKFGNIFVVFSNRIGMSIKIAVFTSTLIKVSERVWSQLVDDLRENFRDQFRLGVSGDGKSVGRQRCLNFWVVEVNYVTVVSNHVDFLDAWDVVHHELFERGL